MESLTRSPGGGYNSPVPTHARREVATVPRIKTETSKKLFREALKVIPGGVNSPVRAFRSGAEDYMVKPFAMKELAAGE